MLTTNNRRNWSRHAYKADVELCLNLGAGLSTTPGQQFILTPLMSNEPAYQCTFYDSQFISSVAFQNSSYKFSKNIYTSPYSSVGLFDNTEGKTVVVKLVKSTDIATTDIYTDIGTIDIELTQEIYPQYKHEFYAVNCYKPPFTPHGKEIAEKYKTLSLTMFIMPLYEGKNLREYLNSIAADNNKVIFTIYAVCKELQRIHDSLGIFIGDIRLENILVREEKDSGKPVIQFFDLDRGYRKNERITYTSANPDSGSYWAPERMGGKKPIEQEARPHASQDIYSLGNMLETIRRINRQNLLAYYDLGIEGIQKFITAARNTDPTLRPSLQSVITVLEIKLNILPPPSFMSTTALLIQRGIANLGAACTSMMLLPEDQFHIANDGASSFEIDNIINAAIAEDGTDERPDSDFPYMAMSP